MLKKIALLAAISPLLVACGNSEFDKVRAKLITDCTSAAGGDPMAGKVCACAFDKAASGFSKADVVALKGSGGNNPNAQKFVRAFGLAMLPCLTEAGK